MCLVIVYASSLILSLLREGVWMCLYIFMPHLFFFLCLGRHIHVPCHCLLHLLFFLYFGKACKCVSSLFMPHLIFFRCLGRRINVPCHCLCLISSHFGVSGRRMNVSCHCLCLISTSFGAFGRLSNGIDIVCASSRLLSIPRAYKAYKQRTAAE